jgi:hypothetical protein
MEEIKSKLNSLLNLIKFSDYNESGKLIEAKNLLELYVTRYFENNLKYQKIIEEIKVEPVDSIQFNRSKEKLMGITKTLIEDVSISYNLNKSEKISIEEIEKLQSQLIQDRKSLVEEEEKFNLFKTKLEIADKSIDFITQANNYRNSAYLWAFSSAIFTCILIYFLSIV